METRTEIEDESAKKEFRVACDEVEGDSRRILDLADSFILKYMKPNQSNLNQTRARYLKARLLWIKGNHHRSLILMEAVAHDLLFDLEEIGG